MLQEFAGEGIPLLASAVPADTFQPHLNELLPLIMNKAVSQPTTRPLALGSNNPSHLLQLTIYQYRN